MLKSFQNDILLYRKSKISVLNTKTFLEINGIKLNFFKIVAQMNFFWGN